jgi:uncharacterized damage-inducible protein DinB
MRPRLALFGLVAPLTMTLVLSTRASSQTTAAPSNPISATFNGFSYYGNWLLAAFDSIPAGRYEYKPTPIQQSVGYIAQHLEDANYQLCAIIGDVKRNRTAKDSLADTIKAKWPKDTLIARLRASMAFCGRVMSSLTDAKLAESITVGSANAGRTAPRARWVILFVTDLAEHYSQLASYMRMIGLVPPSALRPGRQ